MIFCDFHIHGYTSGGTSPSSTIDAIERAARQKGLDIVATSDYLHPKWFQELKAYLKPNDSTGLFEGRFGLKFILSVEVECQWFHNYVNHERSPQKRIHNVICVRTLDDAQRLQKMLAHYANLDIDGRPTVRLTCEQLVNYVKDVIRDSFIFPAHTFTPHTSALSEEHGFDSLKDCYGSALKNISAIETGLSADPEMCSRIPETSERTQISSSDAHSATPARLGREATVLALKEPSYDGIISAIRFRDSSFIGTIEVFPSWGKYHYGGHRYCETSLDLAQYASSSGFCPHCGRKATVGVLQRISNLSHGYYKPTTQKFWTLLPLSDLIQSIYGQATTYVYCQKLYQRFGSEYNILMNVSEQDLTEVTNEKVAKAVVSVREGTVKIIAGYDGKYGSIVIQGCDENIKQKGLTEIFGERRIEKV